MKVAISIGHHPNRPGITNGQYTEHSEMAPIAGFLIQTLIYMGHKPYVVAAGPLGGKIEDVNKLNADCAIELHLNAGGGNGVETLFCPGSDKGKEFASVIHKGLLCGFLSNLQTSVSDRGVKEGWHRMIVGADKDAFLEHTNCPSCITEMYFLDNEHEVDLFAGSTKFYRAMAFSLANSINKWRV